MRTKSKEYFNWLCDKIDPRGYRKLLGQLHATPFHYILPMDGNRYEDGISMRYRYSQDMGMHPAETADDIPCSVLEMLVALATRMEEEIMADSTFGDRTSMWFWDMIRNLELYDMTDLNYDHNYVEERLLIFMDRLYGFHGEDGALFYVEEPRGDMRCADIWAQMQWYLTEKGGY